VKWLLAIVTSLRQLAGELTTGIAMLTEAIAGLPAGHRGYRTIQALPGTGPVLAAVIVVEIGDLTRNDLLTAPAYPQRHRA
jgi:transposase